MKRILTLAAVFIMMITGLVSAQTGPGAMWIGGMAGYASLGGDWYSGEDNSERTTMIALSPTFLYFVAPNLFLGPALTYERESKEDYSRSMLGLGVEVGYTFGSGGGSAIPYLDASFQFGSGNEKVGTSEDKASGTDITLGAGICFKAAKHAGIMVQAGYSMQSMKPEGADKSISGNVFGIEVGVVGLIF